MVSSVSRGRHLAWVEPEGITIWMRLAIAACTIPAGAALLFAANMILTKDEGGIGAQIVAALLGFGGVVCLFAGVLYLLVWVRLSVDGEEGTFTTRYCLLGFLPIYWSVSSLGSVTSVAVKRQGHNLDQYILELKADGDESIEVCRPATMDLARDRAEAIAGLLDLQVEYVKLTMAEAAKIYRSLMVFLVLSALLLAVTLTWFNIKYTVPLARIAITAYRFFEDDLVEVPCHIVAFETSVQEPAPKGRFSVRKENGGNELITECTLVKVLYEYEFEGKHYESSRFGWLYDYTVSDVPAYAAGARTVCYLNPKRPDLAALQLENELVYDTDLLSVVLFNVVALFVFVVMIVIKRLARKRFLDGGWIEESEGQA